MHNIQHWLTMIHQPDPSNQPTQPINLGSNQKTVNQSNHSNSNGQGYGASWGLGMISAMITLILVLLSAGFGLFLFLWARDIPIFPANKTCIDNGKLCIPNSPNWNMDVNTNDKGFIVRNLAELTFSSSSANSKSLHKIYISKANVDPNQAINDLFFEAQKEITNQDRYPESSILSSNYQGIKIDGNDAYKISFKVKEEQTMMQAIRYGIKTADGLYLITFRAEEKDYSKVEADAEKLIESITFP